MDLENLLKIREANKLKETYRNARVGERKESVAEHTWACLIVAEYIFDEFGKGLEKEKVFNLLLFHDIGEIKHGDIPIKVKYDNKITSERELEAVKEFVLDMPGAFGKKVIALHEEFEAGKTKEAKFAKVIDALEGLIHGLGCGEYYWHDWNEEVIRNIYGNRFSESKELEKLFNDFVKYLIKHKYLK